MNKRHLCLLAGIISVIRLVLFLYKSLVLSIPLLPTKLVES